MHNVLWGVKKKKANSVPPKEWHGNFGRRNLAPPAECQQSVVGQNFWQIKVPDES